jgi:hypothetical protein
MSKFCKENPKSETNSNLQMTWQVAEKLFSRLRMSFLRKQESSIFKPFWTPAFAGMTEQAPFAKGSLMSFCFLSYLGDLCALCGK